MRNSESLLRKGLEKVAQAASFFPELIAGKKGPQRLSLVSEPLAAFSVTENALFVKEEV